MGTTDKESYIHRLGRTARASSGVEGRGLTITSPAEEWYFKDQTKELPIKEIEWVDLPNDHSIPKTIYEYLEVKNQ